MIDKTDAERLAAMANALRPDWHIPSLVSMLGNHHRHRAYRDVAVALAWIAADPDTQNPGRLAEAGPWWQATTPDPRTRPTPTPPHKCGHCGGFARKPTGECLDCDIKAQPPTPSPPAGVSRTAARAAVRQAGPRNRPPHRHGLETPSDTLKQETQR